MRSVSGLGPAYLLAVVLIAAACGSGDPAPVTAPPAPGAGPAVSGSPEPAKPVTYSVRPVLADRERATVAATPIEDRVLRRYSVHGGPDWLAVGSGSLWMRTADGHVMRLDPRRPSDIVRVRAGVEVCQGLGANEQIVISCAQGGDVVRIDPNTNKVAARLAVRKMNDQGQIPVAFGRAWVLTGDGSRLTSIADDAVVARMDLGMRCIELTASVSAIWASCPDAGQVLRIDPGRGAVTARVTGLRQTFTLAAGEHVWAGFDRGLAKLDEATGEVLAVADAAPGPFGGITVTADGVWVRAKGRFLRRVDPGTARVLEELAAPERSGGSVVLFRGALWATAYDDNVLYRLRVAKR